MPQIVLDGIDNLAVDSKDLGNEIRTLQMLRQGLFSLTSSVKRREARFAELAKVARFTFVGATSEEEEADLNMVACMFHWFGVSLCNYARLVGFIRGLDLKQFSRSDLRTPSAFEGVSKSVSTYVSGISELAPVLVWRNKVAGHFAITDPRKQDNIATLDLSVMFPVSLDDGVYNVGGMQLTRSNSSGPFTSQIPPWSVTQVFESLIPRFWPDAKWQEANVPAQ